MATPDQADAAERQASALHARLRALATAGFALALLASSYRRDAV